MLSTTRVIGRLSWLPILIVLACRSDAEPGVVAESRARAANCPAAAMEAVSAVFAWHRRMDTAYRDSLPQIRQQVAARLYADLERAFAPPDGEAFLDFDPFSGSQEHAAAYQIIGCRATGSGRAAASVDVTIGKDRSTVRSLVLHLREETADWVLRDVTYPDTVEGQPLRLQGVLDALLRPDAEVLTTPTRRMVVERRCSEGFVTCNEVALEIEALRTGRIRQAVGQTRHTTCADGITPCRFLGYRFTTGDTTIEIGTDGRVEQLVAETVVSAELGTWRR